MALLIRREILSARYRKLVLIGDRAGAKAVAAELRALTAEILRGAA